MVVKNKTYKLVLLRHGESIWNKANRFAGWTDVELTKKGELQSKKAGEILNKNKFKFDLIFTSPLKRSIYTAWDLMKTMNLAWVPLEIDWHLNERHYGALQGLNRDKVGKKYGTEQLRLWRRSYKTKPPLLKITDPHYPGKEDKYKNLKKNEIPLGESLEDTFHRVIPYWQKAILPQFKKDKSILIVAHGNSLRALIKHLEKISDEKIVDLEIKIGEPLVYEFDKNLKVIKKYYL